MARALMCRPDYYGIRYEINPWMRTSRDADPIRAREQWEELHNTLTRRMGVQVELIEPDEAWPDMVFTANAGLVVGRRFVASNFRYPQRAGEAPLYWKWFAARGYTCVALPPGRFFEGEGDALWAESGTGSGTVPQFGTVPGLSRAGSNWGQSQTAGLSPAVLVAGYHFRSDLESHGALAEVLGCQVVSVELRDKRFYHLDTCLAPLEGRGAIWYPPAFDDYAQKAIREVFADLIELEPAEALRFGANAVVLDRAAVVNAGCPRLVAALADRGYEVFSVDLSEFIKAGGAAKCLVLWLER
ncbi:MAG: dimethylarginine dimethylaminohydrolase family protein [Phycisphaerae bacterium]